MLGEDGAGQPALHGAPCQGRPQHHPQDGPLAGEVHHSLTTIHGKGLSIVNVCFTFNLNIETFCQFVA